MAMLDFISKKRDWHRIEYTLANRRNIQNLITIFIENHIDIILYNLIPFNEKIVGEAKAWGIEGDPAFITVDNSESGSEFKINYYSKEDDVYDFFKENFFEKFKPETLSFLFNALEPTGASSNNNKM